MNTWLANEAVESLKDYTQMVEDEYAVRGKCSFYTWKPENIVVDKSCTPGSSLTFNMVDIETCEFQGRITVWGFSHFRNGIIFLTTKPMEGSLVVVFNTYKVNTNDVVYPSITLPPSRCEYDNDILGHYFYLLIDQLYHMTAF